MPSLSNAAPSDPSPAGKRPSSRIRSRAYALLPLLMLAVALAVFTGFDSKIFALIGGNPPPADELSVSRVKFEDQKILSTVTNPQPEPITIAIVTVDDAVANFAVVGGNTLDRFARRSIEIPFAWNEGEPYTIGITSSSGIQTVATVTAAVESVRPSASSILGLGLIGLLVGFLPVALGLMWLPGLRELGETALNGFMALTAGLLVFLFVDALFEALEQQALLPSSFGGVGLVVLGLSISFVGIGAMTDWLMRRAGRHVGEASAVGADSARDSQVHIPAAGLTLATAIAVGIGLHNFGEGLAIGTSFAVGELAFSSLLIVGFTIHNITEGLGIAVPLAGDRDTRTPVSRLALLAVIAGVPAVFGAWLGGFFTSTLLATFFFAVAAGAAAQVVYEVGGYIRRSGGSGWRSPAVAGGFVAGIATMYLTSLIAG